VPDRAVPADEVAAPVETPAEAPTTGEGAMCGGIATLQCDEGLTCIYEDGACYSIRRCCRRLPDDGPDLHQGIPPGLRLRWQDLWQPLRAYAEGVSVAYPGRCEVKES
jgi:hypothetical protein